MRVKLVGVVALMALVVASCAAGTPEAAGPSEGIQVHGDWTIDVYNEDGTLDEHVEFSNALTAGGADAINRVLGRSESAGEWQVTIDGGAGPCTSAGGIAVACRATEVLEHPTFMFPTLVLDTSAAGVLTMAGSVTIQNDSTISGVSTRFATCRTTTDHVECLNSSLAPDAFSQKSASGDPSDDFVETPVTAGQTVQVQVDFSFTSG